IGEFLMASVSFPQEITEHIYVHHAHIGTPKDSVSAPKGRSFWRYLPRSVMYSVLDTWRVERDRLARRRLPVWHYTNPVWRYVFETAAWYALAYWIGGAWGFLAFAAICAIGIVQLRMADYIQHYGLQRIRLPGGRYEQVQARHSWSAAYRVSNWIYWNAQRHADHHRSAGRLYALLKHSGPDEAPQLPGSYARMGNLLMFPGRWFRTMDPLVERWRAHFYPDIDDWSAYDSTAYDTRPDAFEAIAEILADAPRMGAWIDNDPRLLDHLRTSEFTELDLPDGFGPDPEFEIVARRGLARVYWTHEFDLRQMKEQLADLPFRDAGEAAETARSWSSGKVFQVSVHTMRGTLSPVEAGTALSRVAEASIAHVLAAVAEEFAGERGRDPGGGVAVVVLGDIASAEAAPATDLRVLFLHDVGPATSPASAEALCRRFRKGLHTLSRDSLLFAPLTRERKPRTVVRSLAGFREHYRTAASASELQELFRARCVFAAGDPGLAARFDEARRDILTHGAARDALITKLREPAGATTEPDPLYVDDLRGGLRDVQGAARVLQLIHAGACPDVLVAGTAPAFQALGANGLIPTGAAERLEDAAKMWRNLRGILPLTVEDDCSVDTAGSRVKATIARSCRLDDFGALKDRIRDTAARATADIAALNGVPT
ncbi:MAG: fatty acid desaturase, partial [Alphaproteobacteria bacterium]|nr:fatty acid desaturase [Alphaproteobacteria bacterium]